MRAANDSGVLKPEQISLQAIPVFGPCTVQVLFGIMIKRFPTLKIEHPGTFRITTYEKL